MDWEGWYWPNHFGDPVAEHNAVRTDVGVWDASPLRKWDFQGPDALAAADRIFTNDMLGLEIGQVRYAPFCDENGKMVGDGTVFKFADDQLHRGHRARLRSRPLQRRSSTASTSRSSRRTKESPQLGLNGPRSRELLAGPDRRRRLESPLLPLLPGAGRRRRRAVLGLPHRATPASSATSSSAPRTAPSSCGTPSPAPARSRTASLPSRRSGSSRG